MVLTFAGKSMKIAAGGIIIFAHAVIGLINKP